MWWLLSRICDDDYATLNYGKDEAGQFTFYE